MGLCLAHLVRSPQSVLDRLQPFEAPRPALEGLGRADADGIFAARVWHSCDRHFRVQRVCFRGRDYAGGNMKKLLCSTTVCAAFFASAPAIAADVPVAPRPRLPSALIGLASTLARRSAAAGLTSM